MHNPTFRTFTYTTNKSRIENHIATEVRAECYREGGHLVPIKWNDKVVYDNYTVARDYLERTDNGWYDNRAVPFLDYSKAYKTTKKPEKLVTLEKRINDMKAKLTNLLHEKHFANAKSKTISCKNCGSSIATMYMKDRNDCPVCRQSMLPPTTKTRIAQMDETLRAMEQLYVEEQRKFQQKLRNKAETKWLVYYDYHT